MPQDNHYLPIFYQSRWTVPPSGKVCVYFRPPCKDCRVKWVHPAGAGYETDLYTADSSDLRIARYLEDRFFKITDNEGAKSLAFIERGQWNSMKTNVRTGWTRFVLSLLQRTPDEMRAIFDVVSKYTESKRSTFQGHYESIRASAAWPTFEEYWADQLFEITARIWIGGSLKSMATSHL